MENFSQILSRRQYLFSTELHDSAYPQAIIQHDSTTCIIEGTIAYNKWSNKIITISILQQYYVLVWWQKIF